MSSHAAVVVRRHDAPQDTTRVRSWPFVPSVDTIVCGTTVLLAIAAFVFYRHSSDFLGEDAFYADCARSLLTKGFYGIAGRPETNQPPGLPGLLAVSFGIFGYSPAVALRVMAVFEGLGLLASYILLQRQVSKLVAGTICILLITSPLYFQFTTQMVYPSLPFLFTTMVGLLAFAEYERAKRPLLKFAWGTIAAGSVGLSILFASAGIALLSAISLAGCATLFRDKQRGLARLQWFVPILLVGLTVQGWWMHRKPAPLEWSLQGYPRPYIQQLKVKNGNYPELGTATASDVLVRMESNLIGQADKLAQIVLRHGVNETKLAVLIAPVLLIALGWGYSLWQARGESALDWYFAGYEFIYLLWPWGVEHRFFLPVAPLACLYAWKGLEAGYFLFWKRPRITAIVWSPVGLMLGICGCQWLYTHWNTHGFGRFPDELLIPVWLVSSLVAAWMAYKNQPPDSLLRTSAIGKLIHDSMQPFFWRFSRYALTSLVLLLLGIGVVSEVSMAKENITTPDAQLMSDTNVNSMASEIQAGLWLRSHAPIDSIVMARHLPLVFHYAQRKMVWFAPISNSDTLMSGIQSHRVDYVVVIKHKTPYYLPDDNVCFDKLLARYANAFQLVFRQADLRIYQVRPSFC
jgi:hypothetical protein